jgi:hypothetical protein
MSQPFTWSSQWSWNSSTPGLVWNGLIPNPIKPMPTSNDVTLVVTITPAVKAAIIAKIAELAALITFNTGTLSDTDRQGILKLGLKTVGWDEKVAGYMTSRPDLIPAYVDMAAFAQNRSARVDLGDLMKPLGDIWQQLSDTSLIVGKQIYKPELAYYNSAQEAVKHGVPGAQTIVDDLKDRFAGQGHRAVSPASAAKKTP